jgi:nicotinate-nucleotide adenylyltransferase
MMKQCRGILGGTFDPIHHGHLRAALELLQILSLKEVRFVPVKQPVHKDTLVASSKHRLAMLTLAIKDEPGFIIDPREINRHSASYMIETLMHLREDFPNDPLALILGKDAFSALPTWHRWQELLNVAHIIVITRPGEHQPLNETLTALITERHLADSEDLHTMLHGGIYFQTITALEISATAIRSQVAGGLNPRFLLPDPVLEYIVDRHLYRKA